METTPSTLRLHLRDEILPLLFVAASWGLAAWYWPHLPARVPTHWGIDGRPNGWMPMPWGALVGPLVATFTYALMTLIPVIDPRRLHWETTLRFYPLLKSSLVAFMAGITYLSLVAASRPDARLDDSWLTVAIGLLFVVLGNFMPKVRSNFFVGVRTPWTLSSEVVWEKTNRAVGWLMVAGGVLIAATGGLSAPWRFGIIMGVAGSIGLVSLVYSWWLYTRLPNESKSGPS